MKRRIKIQRELLDMMSLYNEKFFSTPRGGLVKPLRPPEVSIPRWIKAINTFSKRIRKKTKSLGNKESSLPEWVKLVNSKTRY
jgi:hypothetical protein